MAAPAPAFHFNEPSKTGIFIEALLSSSNNPQKFAETLENQANTAKDFATPASVNFDGLVVDETLLTFFHDYFRTGIVGEHSKTATTLPVDVDSDAASRTTNTVARCFRTLQADVKGLQIALAVLRDEAEFHKEAATNEASLFEEKREAEIAKIKPTVDKNIKALTQKADKTLATLQKSGDRKIVAIQKRRETCLLKLQTAEQRRDAVRRRIEVAKKRKASGSSSGTFALKKYERDIESCKKEIKALTEETDRLRKETDSIIKQKQAEFNEAIGEEEAKITQIQNSYGAKIAAKRRIINSINVQTAALNTALESQIDSLEERADALKSQVQFDWALGGNDQLFVQLPVYIVKYVKTGEEERYTVVTPIALSQETGTLDELKKMLSLNPEPKLRALVHPASKELQETLGAQLLERLQSDADFKMKLNAVCRASNVIDQNSFAQTLNEGLDEIEKRGFMTREEAAGLCKRVMEETA